jgi:carbon monoxide dehydrogenase subunit G
MVPDGGTTAVSIVTDLSITGRVAQFGRGVMGDVSARLLEQFVRNLEADVLRAGSDGAASGS